MAGIALLLPGADICQKANHILANQAGNHVLYVQETQPETVLQEARKAIAQGANILVARGQQAQMLKSATTASVIEMCITAQELGLMVVRAKKATQKNRPTIGVISWQGMLGDTTHFDELFCVNVLCMEQAGTAPAEAIVQQALDYPVDILLSSDIDISLAKQKNVPALYIEPTEESLKIALEKAEQLYQMSQAQRLSIAQFSSLLDSSISGIVQISESGHVALLNKVAEDLLSVSSENAIGRHLSQLLPSIDTHSLQDVLTGRQDNYSAYINLGKKALVAVIQPILDDGQISGAIVSCNAMALLSPTNKSNTFLHGYTAHGTLDELAKRMPDLKPTVETAKMFAVSASPILVHGFGTEDIDELCQGIHNYSLRKEGPYVSVNMAGVAEEDQLTVLFGAKNENAQRSGGLIDQALYGTLVIRSVDKLVVQAQYHLLHIMNRHYGPKTLNQWEHTMRKDVRIICCTWKDIGQMVNQNRMRRDFYYLLQTYRLNIPNLLMRKNDIEKLLMQTFSDYLAMYSRYHILSPGAKKAILEYPWKNHRLQLEAFVERMIITATKRTINEGYVRQLLEDLYPAPIYDSPTPAQQPTPAQTQEAQIKQALQQFNGHRGLAAKHLNISTTTLWRKMKQYHLL